MPRHPSTFNEKVRFRMMNDRRPELATFVDKVAVRDYIAERVGEECLTELYLVTDDPDVIRREALPREFVVKASHGSGGCVLVGDCAHTENELPRPPVGWKKFVVAPDACDWATLRELCHEWLGLRYQPATEWAYREVPPRVLAEELLLHDGSIPPDYKLYVFHGHVRMIHVTLDRFGERSIALYTPTWEAISVELDVPRGPEVGKPDSLREMVLIAERLGEAIDFVRVDLYDLEGRVVVGELTPYPMAGRGQFRPAWLDDELGSWWTQLTG